MNLSSPHTWNFWPVSLNVAFFLMENLGSMNAFWHLEKIICLWSYFICINEWNLLHVILQVCLSLNIFLSTCLMYGIMLNLGSIIVPQFIEISWRLSRWYIHALLIHNMWMNVLMVNFNYLSIKLLNPLHR